MKLYSGPLSLFSRKVEIALGEKGLSFERVMVPFSQAEGYSPKHPDVLAANPKGQVPVLIDGGLTLYDSTIILEYLEDAYPASPLYPTATEEGARCRQLELFADEIMLVPLRSLMGRTGPRPADPALRAQAEAEATRAEGAIAAQHAEIDRKLQGNDYVCGGLSVADIALFMMVLFGQRLGGPALEGHAALSAWYGRLRSRPLSRKSRPKSRPPIASFPRPSRPAAAADGHALGGVP